MDAETIENYRKAGNIAAQALEYAVSLVKPGTKLVDICRKIEDKIKELGGDMAFPVQISMDDTAAHFCPDEEDETIFEDQLVSVDVGVHVNGFIGDNAGTVDLSGKNEELVKASKEALENAISKVKPGATLAEIGRAIHDTITSYGFAPVRNLSGHGLGEYNVHTKPSVPNYDNGDDTKLKEGDIIAIEPFASAGAGIIYESSNPSIFSLSGKKPSRNMITRKAIKKIEEYDGLPFCRRWLSEDIGKAKAGFALRDLKNLGILREYPPLIDKDHGLVSQAEHTLLVTEDGCEILTRA